MHIRMFSSVSSDIGKGALRVGFMLLMHDHDLPQRPEMGKDISDLAFFQPDLAGACMHVCVALRWRASWAGRRECGPRRALNVMGSASAFRSSGSRRVSRWASPDAGRQF